MLLLDSSLTAGMISTVSKLHSRLAPRCCVPAAPAAARIWRRRIRRRGNQPWLPARLPQAGALDLGPEGGEQPAAPLTTVVREAALRTSLLSSTPRARRLGCSRAWLRSCRAMLLAYPCAGQQQLQLHETLAARRGFHWDVGQLLRQRDSKAAQPAH